MANYSHMATPTVVKAAYEGDNFSQAVANTRIFPGDDTPRTFTRCNLVNCDLPPGSTKIDSMHGHLVRDAPNDIEVVVDGTTITEEAWKIEKVT